MPSAPAAKKRKTSAAVQSPLETYLREINETALLSAAEERELATKIGNGDTAGVHHPKYDFSDSAISAGVSYWARLAEMAMPA